MKKLSAKRKINLIATGVMTSACFLALVFATYSWFTVNKNASSNSSATIIADDMEVNYTLYRADNETHDITATSKSDGHPLSNLSLNMYDAVFVEKNHWNPIITRFEITGVPQSGSIGFYMARNISATDDSEEQVSGSSETKLASLISNMCKIGAAIHRDFNFDAGGNKITEADDIFNNSKKLFEDNPSWVKRFATVNYDDKGTADESDDTISSFTKTSYVNFDIAYDSTSWVDTTGDGYLDTLYLYLYIDYDDELANAYIAGTDKSMIQIISGGGITVNIANDLSVITLNHA